ncbi:hypothetical protein ABIF50_005404 [Bradyrhizobium diazoefficiens]
MARALSGPLEGFGFGGGVRYIGSSWADTANTLEVPAVVLGDLALHGEIAVKALRRDLHTDFGLLAGSPAGTAGSVR